MCAFFMPVTNNHINLNFCNLPFSHLIRKIKTKDGINSQIINFGKYLNVEQHTQERLAYSHQNNFSP